MQAYANVHINANARIQPRQSIAELPQRRTYRTTAATAAKAPAAPIPIAGPMCTAAPLAFVETLLVLPVCVFVPLPVEPLVEVVEPPFAVPVRDAVVDVGVDAVLVTEPAVITTGRKETWVPDRVVPVTVASGTDTWVRRAPVASALHTATELPEITQFRDMVLRGSQSRIWPNKWI